ncbi:MAG TPA: LamG domain-containing protein, partial [Candidatus Limnocylindrales bacterium]
TIDNQVCATGDGRAVVGIPTPTMRARATDPDGAAGGQLGVIFTWDRWDAGTGTWTGQGWIEVGNIPHDSVAQLMIPAGYLANGGRYRWHTYAHDGVFDNSPWSDWCEFDVDTAGPTVAPTVTSPVYRDDLVNFYGAVGKTANFTLGANGIGDVAGYKWGWVSPPITQVAAASLGASVTLPLTPPPPNPATPTLGGLATLYVTSYDRTGRPSPERRYTFLLGSATNPAGRWDLAEPAGATNLADSSGAGRAATLLGGATGQPSRFQALAGLPTALTLDGIDDFAGVPGPTVDTSTSFTVSAWVRPETADDGFRTIVGVGGTRTSPFTLSRTGDRWIFWLNKTDDDVPVAGAAVAATFSRPGVWSHVVGVYDAGARQVQIYVDGRLEASEQQVWAPFRSTGATEIGRGIWTGVFDPTWHGGIAEVRLWDRVLSAGEVAAMAATLTANWGLDGDGFDSAAVPHDLTDPGTLTWTRDRRGVDAAAVSLNGIDQALTVVAGPVRTEQSFTATAWVNLRAVPTGPKAAVSMDDGVNHSFFLGFRLNAGNPCWNFVTHDGAGHSLHIFAPLTPSTDAGDWVHLAGVFDAQAGLMRLYVNGVLTATGPKVSNGPPTGTARTTVGETRWGGLLTDRWPGAIDDVRLYQGALPATEIAKLAVS